MLTDEKRQLQLCDVADLPIGYVPRSLAPNFREIMDKGGKVSAIVTGDPVPSYPPWPLQNEPGGGLVLPCDYVISTPCKDDHKIITDTLNHIPEGSAMELLMC
ncbi:hypothetical protein DPMN_183082 [Dreissena polymorpha]|uniref:Uncharacterized protein n=1 Tax=Dreissena polymorpha TaxID=45954 RepID=A0A9D4DHK0_DREPO|nr:hypothetical protein DPMN_183082 [Dreissena polymorpha]